MTILVKYLFALSMLLVAGCKLVNVQDHPVPPFVEPDACHYAIVIRADSSSTTGYRLYIQNSWQEDFQAELAMETAPIPLQYISNENVHIYRTDIEVYPGHTYSGKVTLNGLDFDFSIKVVYPIQDYTWNNNLSNPTVAWTLEESNTYQLLDGYWGTPPQSGRYMVDLDPKKRGYTYPTHPYYELNLYNINMNTYQELFLGVYSYSDHKLLLSQE